MITIEKIEIEYVVPESKEEELEIKEFISKFEKEKNKKRNLSDYALVKKRTESINGKYKSI